MFVKFLCLAIVLSLLALTCAKRLKLTLFAKILSWQTLIVAIPCLLFVQCCMFYDDGRRVLAADLRIQKDDSRRALDAYVSWHLDRDGSFNKTWPRVSKGSIHFQGDSIGQQVEFGFIGVDAIHAAFSQSKNAELSDTIQYAEYNYPYNRETHMMERDKLVCLFAPERSSWHAQLEELMFKRHRTGQKRIEKLDVTLTGRLQSKTGETRHVTGRLYVKIVGRGRYSLFD